MAFNRAVFGRMAWLWVVLCVASAAAFACAADGDDKSRAFDEVSPNDQIVSGDAQGGGLTIEPPTATLIVKNGAIVTQAFKLVRHKEDGTAEDVSNGVDWSATNLQVGNVNPTGLYTPRGVQGGLVKITASHQGIRLNADLTVKLHVEENPSNLDPGVQAALRGATAIDSSVVWAYPYQGTVFPRGLEGPRLMWNNAGNADVYYVHVTSPTFELETFTTAPPPSRFAFSPGTWQKFVDSTAGAASLQVNRLNGSASTSPASVIVKHGWKIAAASMRGTIYYWANNVGRVMRIKPCAAAPDDFSAGTFGSLPASECTMTCHTVSADGSTLVSGGDTMGGSYNLLTNKPIYDTDTVNAGPGSGPKRAWALAAISPNGKYVIENATPGLPGPPGAGDGIYHSDTGKRVLPATGLEGVRFGMPAFSADGSKIAYIDLVSGALSAYDFNLTTVKAGANTLLMQQGTGGRISWPSVSPDAKWMIYQRGSHDTRVGNADFFLANASIPNQEIRLAQLNGDGYPFAAGARDASFNFEATFAPVASGGYFWVVFTSRRTYGNQSTGTKDEVKQLWVAAIDLNPTVGVDPSHPAFLLPGQDTSSLNMRGYWALDPCKGNGQGCTSGTECCGGYCDSEGPDGALVCKPGGSCAREGDHCDVSADCCNVAGGSTCINHACSEPPPR